MSTPTDPRRGEPSPDQSAREGQPAQQSGPGADGEQPTSRNQRDDGQAERSTSAESASDPSAPAGQPPAHEVGYGQPAQDASAQQPTPDQSARDQSTWDQSTQYNPYGQPGQYGTPSQYPQPGQYTQSGPYGQASQYPQPGQYGQPGEYGQPSQYPQPGQYGQPGAYQGAYGQPGQYGAGPYGAGPYGGQPAGADQGQYAYNPYGTPYPAGLGETGVHAVPRPGIMVLSLVLLILAALPFLAVATILLAIPLDPSFIPPGFDLQGQLAEAGVTFEVLASALRIGAAIVLVLALLYIVFAITAFTGRNWARVVLTIMTLGFALLLVAGLATGGAVESGSLTFVLLVLVAAVGGTVLLYLPDVNRFFASPRR